VVGYVAIRFKPATLSEEVYANRLAYVESFIISCFAAFFFFAVIYYLTIRHIREFNQQVDLVQMGRIKEIGSPYLMEELIPLKRTVNSLLARLREFTNSGGESGANVENDEYYLNIFYHVLKSVEHPALLLDGNKNIKNINPQAEDLLGIREAVTSGASLLDNLRDQGLAATILEAADNSSSNSGTIQEGQYEIKGVLYKISAVAVLGKDTYAKSYFLTFIKEKN
jgi:PAS domain-containing protein